jgi:hypothetical protein
MLLYIYENIFVILGSIDTFYQETVWPTHHPIKWVPEALSLVVKQPEREANAEIKNVGAISPFPNMSSWHSARLIKPRHNHRFLRICYATQ